MINLGRNVRKACGYILVFLGAVSIIGVFILEIIGMIWALTIHNGLASLFVWFEFTGAAIGSLIEGLFSLGIGSALVDVDDLYRESFHKSSSNYSSFLKTASASVIKPQHGNTNDAGIRPSDDENDPSETKEVDSVFNQGERVFINGICKTGTIVSFEKKTSTVILDSDSNQEIQVDSKQLRRVL
jgi:hypothetical protein